MRDWTFTDGDGDRWGVSDGQLHLGGLAIPLPLNVQGSAAQRDYMRSFDEMARQGANALIQQSVRERQEAIRARRDAERAAALSATRPRPRAEARVTPLPARTPGPGGRSGGGKAGGYIVEKPLTRGRSRHLPR
jgi:hypothetical protein